jgi:hypothetical protein
VELPGRSAECHPIPVKLDTARSTPPEQREKASKIRALKKPDVEVRLFFMKCARLIFLRTSSR